MWYQFPQQVYNICSPRKLDAIEEDTHCHSPHGGRGTSSGSGSLFDATTAVRLDSHGLMLQSRLQTEGRKLEDCLWPEAFALPDPFVEGGQVERKTSSNQSLPDCPPIVDFSRPLSPASSRSVSHNHDVVLSTAHVAFDLPASQFDELLADCTPHEDTSNGTCAPTNTRVNSATNTPQMQAKLSAAAESNAALHSSGQPRSVPVTMRDPPPIATAVNISINLVDQPEITDPHGTMLTKNPSKDVRSKKEGNRGSGHGQTKSATRFSHDGEGENSKDSIEQPITSASKRKRLGLGSSSFGQGENDSSPSRKVLCQDRLSGSFPEDVRKPLSSLGPLGGVN